MRVEELQDLPDADLHEILLGFHGGSDPSEVARTMLVVLQRLVAAPDPPAECTNCENEAAKGDLNAGR